jgi:hypothetical protein
MKRYVPSGPFEEYLVKQVPSGFLKFIDYLMKQVPSGFLKIN